ncbi:MAG: PQQ-dependent sugar dehydrogenase [Myxococcales bacterium]|nr:MAG: PQQ-dependent sugar dehydrogenase [Myxococcales bacterium]
MHPMKRSVAFFMSGCFCFAVGCSPSGEGVKRAPDDHALSERPQNSNCVAFERPVFANSVAVERVFENLSFSKPVAMLQAPNDDSRWYVVEQDGRIKVFDNQATASSAQDLVDLSAAINSVPGEAGLLGMAFHPDFENNNYVFLSFTFGNAPMRSRISRYTVNANGTSLDSNSERVILTLEQPYDNHNGGNIAFGPDGFLYIGFGDGGSGGDPNANGQNPRTLLAALLRIDVDSANPYGIPADNPFANSSCDDVDGGCPEIYAWGLRNPWRWSFDSLTGELWLADVGQETWEEVNRIVLGGNYGWNTREGMHCFSAQNCDASGLIDPVAEYDHSEGESITGGFVYRGQTIPSLSDAFVYGDFVSGRLWKVGPDGDGGFQEDMLVDSGLSISSFAQDHNGEIYILDYGTGGIYQLVAGAQTDTLTVPELLSQTGCVDPQDPKTPDPGMIPYDINALFWSDGALKTRYFTIPDGTRITIGSDDDWEFPVGTVLLKNFDLADQRVETRLLVRHEDGNWAGYSYEWNDDQSDATWLRNGKTRDVAGQTWIYPSSAQCLQCHTNASGRSLGLETAQLNKDLLYESSKLVGNQLTTLAAIGMFTSIDSIDPSLMPLLPNPQDENESLENRARAYLHTNCSQCHRPGGPTNSIMDLRFTTSLADAEICDELPTDTTIKVDGLRLLAPGLPDASLLVLRMQRRDQLGMPPLGSNIIDEDGASLLSAWISQLSNCP